MIIRFLTASLMLIGLTAGLVAGSTGPARAEVINRIVAEVNDDVITLQDLEEIVKRIIPLLKKKTTSQTFPLELAKARRYALSQLILFKLEEQQFKRLKLTITKNDVDLALKRLLDRNHITRKQFLVQLKNKHQTEAIFRRDLKRHLVRGRLMRIVTRGRIIVTEQEIQDVYQRRFAGGAPPPGPAGNPAVGGTVHLAAIVIPVEPGSGRAALAKARRLASRIHARLKRGANFAALARKHNPEGMRANGGDLGTVQMNMMRPQMARLVAGLAKGQVSPVMRTPRGFQILKKIDQIGGGSSSSPPPAASTAPPPGGLTPSLKRRIRVALVQQKMRKAYQKWLDDLRRRSHIKITP